MINEMHNSPSSFISQMISDYKSQLTALSSFSSDQFPLTEAKLISIYNNISKSIKVTKHKNQYYTKAKQKLKEMHQYTLSQTYSLLKDCLYKYLKKQFAVIEKKIKTNEIDHMTALNKELESQGNIYNSVFNRYTSDNEMQLKMYLYLDFKLKMTQFASAYYYSRLEAKFVQLSNANATANKARASLTIPVDDNTINSNSNSQHVRALSSQLDIKSKKQLESLKQNESLLKERIKQLTIEKEQSTDMLLNLKQKYEIEIKKLQDKYNQYEASTIANDHQLKINESNKEKERQIYEMTLSNLQSQIDEGKKRESGILIEYQSKIKGYCDKVKALTNEYESKIKDLNDQIELQLTKHIDLEGKIKSYEQLLSYEKMVNEDLKNKHKHELNAINNKLIEQKDKYTNDKNKLMYQLDIKEKSMQKLIAKQKDNEDDIIINLRLNEDKLIKKCNQIEQQYISQKQQNEFLIEQAKDLTEQLNQMKHNQEKLVDAFNIKTESNKTIPNNNSTSIEDKMEGIQNIFIKEKSIMENDHKKTIDYYLSEMTKLKTEINSLQNDLESKANEISELKRTIEGLNEKNKEYIRQSQLTENIRDDFNKELNKQMTITIDKCEQRLNDKEQHHQQEIIAINKSSEQTLNQMKLIFTKEKANYEDRITQLKIKYDKDIALLTSEYESKLKESEKDHHIELEDIQLNYNELKAKYNQISIGGIHEISILKQNLLSSERIIKENKETMINIAKEHNSIMQEKLNSFNEERKEFNTKIDSMQCDLNRRDNEIKQLTIKVKSFEETIKTKDNELLMQKKDYESTIDSILNKMEQYKSKQTEIANEFNVKKMDFDRETRLLKQQIDFLNSKLEGQAVSAEEQEKINEDNIIELKSALEANFNAKLDQFAKEKQSLNSKLLKAEELIKSSEEKLNSMSLFYEQKLQDEKTNYKLIYNQLENELMALSLQTEKLNKKSNDPIKKINDLIETQTRLKKENDDYRDNLIQLEKESDDKELVIKQLMKEKQDAVNENDNLSMALIQLKLQFKVKTPKSNVIDMQRKYKANGMIGFDKSSKGNTHRMPTNSSSSGYLEIKKIDKMNDKKKIGVKNYNYF